MTALSIFDLDRTITRTGTWTPWLEMWVVRTGRWRFALLPLLALASLGHALGLLSRGQLKEIAQRLAMGSAVPRAAVEAAAARYAIAVLSANFFPGALAQIAADRAQGRRIVIATASNAFYARAIAARLGIDDVIATESVWDGGLLRPKLAGPNCYGAAKLARVEAWLAAHALTNAPIRFYSDHISDLPLFERATEPVAATPSAQLRAVAKARGWRIVDWGTPKASLFERA